MGKKYDYYVKDHMQMVHDSGVADQDTEVMKRAFSVGTIIEMLKGLQGNDVYQEDSNNIVDTDNNFNYLDALESCYRNINFYDDYARHIFLIKSFAYSNNNDKRTRVGIRNLLNSTRIDLNNYLDNILYHNHFYNIPSFYYSDNQ